MEPTTTPTVDDLRARLGGLTSHDEHRLGRRLDGLRRDRADGRGAALAELAVEVVEAEARVAARRATAATITYPDDLPITARREELLEVLRDHQVVVVAGETGSGKSTQLPKLLLEVGRGVRGLIGHTQPRRLAARTVAERIASELGGTVGGTVGYAVRFTDQVGPATQVKLMTDGILLAELQRDRMLRRYDTIIIDEAHERSLNVDFLLGYLKQLLPRRPDLKVVVTSATIDTERFSQHFGGAPIVEVSGRTYPVEIRYRPLGDEAGDERDQPQAICDAVVELRAEVPGDVLVFCSGEREIGDAVDALRRLELRHTEIVPLYARLSSAEQHRIFEPHTGSRVVVATNVAETSLTVPGVRSVVDAGTARISRYSRRLKVQRLPIEPISQASANQRAGRCGRVAPGTCIRLYAEDDFEGRPAYTDPEVLRTNLASVILQMAALGLGDVAAFPFVDPPDARAIRDGLLLLEELGAIEPGSTGGSTRRSKASSRPERPGAGGTELGAIEPGSTGGSTRRSKASSRPERPGAGGTELGAIEPPEPNQAVRLTPLGRKLAQLPVDPRLGRMVLEADRQGCLREVLVIAAALSIQDPRERPQAHQQAAADAHRRFATEGSDFLAYLRLWDHLRAEQKALSSNQFRRLCKAEFLNHLRVREWQDLFSQLRQVAGGLGLRLGSEEATPDAIHRALLAGLLSHIGLRDGETQEYRGARGLRFVVARGSSTSKATPRWVVAGELVETNRLWARTVARIQPAWVEQLAGHLVARSYGEPRWDGRQGQAVVTERVTLYGLPIVTGRAVPLHRVDPEGARDLFVWHALVDGDWGGRHPFQDDNRALVDELRQLEARARRRDLLRGDDALFAFYDDRLGPQVVNARTFDQWWSKARRADPRLLHLTAADVLEPAASDIDAEAFPDRWEQGDLALSLSYEFAPGTPHDGVTVHVPLPVLNKVADAGFDWQVPGRREEQVVALIRSLPKVLRRHLVPAQEHAAAFLERKGPADGPLLDVLARELGRMAGVVVPVDAFDLAKVPDHLRVTFAVDDGAGAPVASGRDLAELRRSLAADVQAAIATATASSAVERTGLKRWELGDLPRRVTSGAGVEGFPALVDEGTSVGVRVLGDVDDQVHAMRAGTRRLLLLHLPSGRKVLDRVLANDVRLALAATGYGNLAELTDDCARAAVDRLVDDHGGPAWDEAAFDALRRRVEGGFTVAVAEVGAAAGQVLTAAAAVHARLDEAQRAPAAVASVEDMRTQLVGLVHPGFVTVTGAARLADVVRYVRGIERRLAKLGEEPGRDRLRMAPVRELERHWWDLEASYPPGRVPGEVAEVRWLLEELRVSLFAQALGTARPVSEQRVRKALSAASRGRRP